jgi:hypothetical protein
MGLSHLRLLTVFDEQLIMGASLRLAHLRIMVGPLSFPLHGLMTNRYRGESAVCLSSGRGGISSPIRPSVVKISLPRIPRVFTVSRERVALIPTVSTPIIDNMIYLYYSDDHHKLSFTCMEE